MPKENKIYDLIIIGAGPAGLTASIYASRYKLSNVLIGKQLGGELSLAHNVCNFPGFESISGIEFAEKCKRQVEKLGAEVLLQEVGKIEVGKDDEVKFKVYLKNNSVYYSKSLIIATGSERRRLNIPGEEKYLGRGVSYCTTCDAGFFKDKTVAIIGGSDAAVTGAIHLSNFASKVYIIYRGDKLRAEPVWLADWQNFEKKGKGEVFYKTNVKEILGDGTKVTGIKLDVPYKGKETLVLDGVFVEIGGVPGTSLLKPLGVKLEASGHVVVSEEMETNIPGLFCAGDMTSFSANFKQAITAAAQGARAAGSVYKFIKQAQIPRQLGI